MLTFVLNTAALIGTSCCWDNASILKPRWPSRVGGAFCVSGLENLGPAHRYVRYGHELVGSGLLQMAGSLDGLDPFLATLDRYAVQADLVPR